MTTYNYRHASNIEHLPFMPRTQGWQSDYYWSEVGIQCILLPSVVHNATVYVSTFTAVQLSYHSTRLLDVITFDKATVIAIQP